QWVRDGVGPEGLDAKGRVRLMDVAGRYATREGAEAHIDDTIREIEASIARLQATVPSSGDGADYLACRIADRQADLDEWCGLVVVHRANLRPREDWW